MSLSMGVVADRDVVMPQRLGGVGVYRQKEIAARIVGDCGAPFEGNVLVALSGQHYIEAGAWRRSSNRSWATARPTASDRASTAAAVHLALRKNSMSHSFRFGGGTRAQAT